MSCLDAQPGARTLLLNASRARYRSRVRASAAGNTTKRAIAARWTPAGSACVQLCRARVGTFFFLRREVAVAAPSVRARPTSLGEAHRHPPPPSPSLSPVSSLPATFSRLYAAYPPRVLARPGSRLHTLSARASIAKDCAASALFPGLCPARGRYEPLD